MNDEGISAGHTLPNRLKDPLGALCLDLIGPNDIMCVTMIDPAMGMMEFQELFTVLSMEKRPH